MAVSSGKVLVELRDITKSYSREVLRVERLAIEEGKIYGVIGPSGAGKSTLLRVMNLLTAPDGGTLLFGGEKAFPNGRRNPVLRRRMTMVGQKPFLFAASVRGNVAYGLKARGWKREEIEKKVAALLDRIGLSGMAGQHAKTLSGGEAQRVALARAVAFEPDLLLLDEPTANLDPANVEQIENLIRDLNRASGITMVMVTHNIFQARRVADAVIFLHEGRVVEMGETGRFFAAPEDPRTRAFIEGRMIY